MTSAARSKESKLIPTEDSCDSCSDAPEKDTEITDEPNERSDDNSKVTSLTSTLLVYIIAGNVMLHLLNSALDKKPDYDSFSPMELIRQIPPIQQDVMCSELTNNCYSIIDRFLFIREQVAAYRSIQATTGMTGLLLSDARLRIPEPLTFQLLDTSKWQLDRLSIRLNYAQTMISGLFFSGAVEYNSTKKYDIVLMGVAGGVINNFLRTMPNQVLNITAIDIDPVMKRIAERWFEFEESPLSRIIVEDGIVYAQGAAKKGETYDAILLDLSDNKPAELIAPIKEFLTDEVVSTLASIIKESGVLIATVITQHDSSKEGRKEVEKVQKQFEKHFPQCVMIRFGITEQMLFCYKTKQQGDKRQKMLTMKMIIDEHLGFYKKTK
ncbi:hypothetical protein Aduo_016455 [Ancylostoma duodenale]